MPGMHVDLPTLYALAIGTLLASAGMTVWERRSHPKRSGALGMLALAYVTLAVGCVVAVLRRDFPGVWGSALANLIFSSGYFLILHGVATLNRRRYRALTFGVLGATALSWLIGGTRWESVWWAYVSAVPITIACGVTARELLRTDGMQWVQSRHIAVIVAGGHGLFYAGRAFVLPWLVAPLGLDFVVTVGKITMYEGVLYSVILPMTLLRIFREEAHGQLLLESQTDYLTGLGNRRWFFEEGTRVVRDAKSQTPLTLLAFDLDHFKTINDRFGHKTGDDVLRAFSDIAKSTLGEEAILARIGGEEFAAILQGCDGMTAKTMAEAVARRFTETIAHSIDRPDLEATVSAGLALHGNGAVTFADLLAMADRALYSAKSLGRNRVEIAQGPTVRRAADANMSPASISEQMAGEAGGQPLT